MERGPYKQTARDPAPSRDRRTALDLLSWGLFPHFTKDLKAARKPINARAETVGGIVRDVSRRPRPPPLHRAGGPVLREEGWTAPDSTILLTYTIVTTAGNSDMAGLHDRMPLVLEQGAWATWLDGDPGEITPLLSPPNPGVLRMWPVSRAVNVARNNGRELIEYVPDGSGRSAEVGVFG